MIEGDQLIQKDVRKKFDRCAENFDNYDFFHTHCRENLFERLDLIKLKPEFILNLGSAIGSGSELPAWAAPAVRKVSAIMAQRGLGASSMAAVAMTL